LHVGADAVIHWSGRPAGMTATLASPGLPRDPGVLKAIARVGLKQIIRSANSLAPVCMPRSSRPESRAVATRFALSVFSRGKSHSLPQST
jgi:hypothetical protein